jgi:hypothetical protein
MTLKEQLQARSASNQKTLTLESAPEIEVTIRRITLAERNEIARRFDKKDVSDLERGSGFSVALISKALVPSMPEEEVMELDAQFADELVMAINEFHGWTKKGRTEATDQFRPTT